VWYSACRFADIRGRASRTPWPWISASGENVHCHQTVPRRLNPKKSPMNEPTDEIATSLESILITEQLNKRPSRPPDYEMENRALLSIAQHMADSPRSTLQKLAEIALKICRADSAGVSLLSKKSGDFYWPAVAGAWKPHIGGGTPRNFGPCGVVLDRDAMQLFRHPEQFYPYLLPIAPPVTEALLTPFYVRGEAIGTVWVVAHSADRKFDAEDLRLIESLGRFAAAVYPLQAALELEEHQAKSLRDVNEQLLVSSVRQHELIEKAQTAEAALRGSEERLAGELSATQQLQSVSALLIEGGSTNTLNEKILDAAVSIMHSDMASMQALDEDQDALRLLGWRGFDPSFEPIFRLVRVDDETSCGAARRAGHRVVIPDVEHCDFIVSPVALESHRKAGIRAVQSTPLCSRDGRLIGMISTHWHTPHTPTEGNLRLFDILARQAADLVERTQAEEMRGRLAAIVESSADAIVSKDLNGLVRTWNAGAQRLFGYTAQEAIGQPISMLIPPDHADEEPSILDRVRRGERVEHYETIRRRKDGTLVNVSLTVSPIFDEQGQVLGASKIARDITDRKRIEQERRNIEQRERAIAVTTAIGEMEAELARVSRALTVGELATSIAHEVNQPLAGIVTNAQACLRWLNGNTPDLHEVQESLGLIVRDGNRASEVIRRIREFLKKDSPHATRLDINDVVRETLTMAHLELLKDHVAVRIELSSELPLVWADRIQLQQVILNLIMNGREALTAVMDRPRELELISQKSGEQGVRVAVRDSGTGMDPEKIERIFDAFFTTKPTGMGMGLSISRSIIEAHGGRIWATHNDGPGITVQFTLPGGSENS
jgi:PAS domain S-box-containing protein